MRTADESSPYLRARANLSELKLDEMAAAMPDYVRLVADGERDFAHVSSTVVVDIIGVMISTE